MARLTAGPYRLWFIWHGPGNVMEHALTCDCCAKTALIEMGKPQGIRMKTSTFLSAVAVSVAASTSAFAQSAGGFYIDGTVSALHLSQGSSEFYLLGDVNAGYSFGSFGLEFGMLGVRDDDGDGGEQFFGGISYTLGNGGKIVVGAPRIAYDFYAQPDFAKVNRFYGTVLFTGISGSSIFSSPIASFPDIYGVRYDGSATNLRFSASLHTLDDGDATGVSAGAEYDAGYATFSGAFTYFFDSTDTIHEVRLRAEKNLDLYTLALTATNTDLGGSGNTAIEGSLLFEPTDRVDLRALALSTGSGNDPLYGLGANYSFGTGGSAGASALLSDGADPLYEISVNFDF